MSERGGDEGIYFYLWLKIILELKELLEFLYFSNFNSIKNVKISVMQ